MTKEQILELLTLLSALESWSFANGATLPDYLFERLEQNIQLLSSEVLR